MADDAGELIFRSPSNHENFSVRFPMSGTLAELQKRLQETYPGSPPPSDQVLVYAGKVLKDARVTIGSLTGKDASEGPFYFHMIVRKGGVAAGSATSSSPAAAPAPAPSRTTTPAAAATSTSSTASSDPRPIPPPTITGHASTAQPNQSSRPGGIDHQPSSAAAAELLYRRTVHVAPPGSSPATQQPADGPLPGAAPAAGMGPVPAPNAGVVLPFVYYNPLMAAAYQAAYSAALSAITSTAASQQQATSTSTAPAAASAAPVALMPMYMPAFAPAGFMHPAFAAQQFGAAGVAQQAGGVSTYPPIPMAYMAAGSPWTPAGQAAHNQQHVQVLHGNQEIAPGVTVAQLWRALDADAAGNLQQQGQPGLRHRLRAMRIGAGAAQQDNNQQAAAVAAARRERDGLRAQVQARAAPRVARPRLQIRINARGFLQVRHGWLALVFIMVLYQHFTWHRFLALCIGGAVLYVTANWAPLRHLVRGIHNPPARPAAGAAGAGALGAGQAAAGAPAAAAPDVAGEGGVAQPAGAPPPAARGGGIFREALVFIVGFITSLLPAWNFNPEDAAVFAAAQQELAAAEERARRDALRQQQEAEAEQQQQQQEEGQGAGAADEPGDGAAGHEHQD